MTKRKAAHELTTEGAMRRLFPVEVRRYLRAAVKEANARERVKLSPQMERMLAVMEPGVVYNTLSIQPKFYGASAGSYGYVHAGRGRGTGSMQRTFEALERRGLVERVSNGWRREESE